MDSGSVNPIIDNPFNNLSEILSFDTFLGRCSTPSSDFHHEIEHVCGVLQAVNLRTTIPPHVHPQCLSENKKAALAEIVDILRDVCHAHSLPLALTWIPSSSSNIIAGEPTRVQVGDDNSSSSDRNVLYIEESACYVNNKTMQDFVEACTELYLKKGHGIAGKALESNRPFFSHDIKGYDVREYPLVHHARKFGLNAAVAIRIRSTYTSTDDYILEFFLPVNCKGSMEQRLLLRNLSSTMQRLCKSLRTVSDAELVGNESNITSLKGRVYVPLTVRHGETSQRVSSDSEFDLRENFPFDRLDHRNEARELNIARDQRQRERKRMRAEQITVKATYKEDSVRFKYDPHGGCLQLFDQIGKRFQLSIGTFQLKYLDDEKELVMLASESDLQECLEVLESIGSHCIKLSVRDIPSAIGSSASSKSSLVFN